MHRNIAEDLLHDSLHVIHPLQPVHDELHACGHQVFGHCDLQQKTVGEISLLLGSGYYVADRISAAEQADHALKQVSIETVLLCQEYLACGSPVQACSFGLVWA